MGWTIYDIELKLHEPPIFYLRGNVLTSIANLEFPQPSTCSNMWDPNTNSFIRMKTHPGPDRIVVPMSGVMKTDLLHFNKYMLKEMFEHHKYGDNYGNKENLFLVKKEFSEWYEVGLFIYNGITETPNLEMQNYYDKLMKMKVFL